MKNSRKTEHQDRTRTCTRYFGRKRGRRRYTELSSRSTYDLLRPEATASRLRSRAPIATSKRILCKPTRGPVPRYKDERAATDIHRADTRRDPRRCIRPRHRENRTTHRNENKAGDLRKPRYLPGDPNRRHARGCIVVGRLERADDETGKSTTTATRQ